MKQTLVFLVAALFASPLLSAAGDKEAISKKVAGLNKALNSGDPTVVRTELFGDGLAVWLGNTPGGGGFFDDPTTEGYAKTRLEPLKGKSHTSKVTRVRFPRANVAVANVDYSAGDLKKSVIFVFLNAKRDPGDETEQPAWRLRAISSMLPPAAEASPQGPLDGTEWSLEWTREGMTESVQDRLIFDDGVFLSAVESELVCFPGPYTSKVKGETITWSAKLSRETNGESRWEGTVSGTSMTGKRSIFDKVVKKTRSDVPSISWEAKKVE